MRDDYGKIIRTDFDKQALARTVSSAISSTTEITFNTATTVIRVFADSKAIYLKWGTLDCAADRFDEYIQAGTSRDFAIPIDPATSLPFTACNVLESAATATLVLIEK